MSQDGLTYLPVAAGLLALALFLGLYAVAWLQTPRSGSPRPDRPQDGGGA